MHNIIRILLTVILFAAQIPYTMRVYADVAPLPLSRTPRIIFKGATAQDRVSEVDELLRRMYPKAAHDERLFVELTSHLAQTAVPDESGRLCIHPRVWAAALAQHNRCAHLIIELRRFPMPPPFSAYLEKHVVDLILRDSIDVGNEWFLAMAGFTRAESTVLEQPTPGSVTGWLQANVPDYAQWHPLAQKTLLDALARINPNFCLDGLLVFDRLPDTQTHDAATVPDGRGRYYVYTYRIIDPAAPLVIPPVSMLQGLQTLQHADLSDFAEFDLRTLPAEDVRMLDLSHTAFDNPAALTPFRALQSLRLRGTPLNEATLPENLPLTTLDISETAVTDLTPLKGLPLEHLSIRATNITDPAPLAEFRRLKTLDMQETLIESLSPLADLKLEELLLDRKPWPDMKVIEHIGTLRTVSDYPPKDWLAGTADSKWRQPARVRLPGMRGGREIALTLDSRGDNPAAPPSIVERTRLFFRFDEEGELNRAYATEDGEYNIIYIFDPLLLKQEGDKLICEAVVNLAHGSKNRNPYTGRVPLYEYKLTMTQNGKAVRGAFDLRYEIEVFDPHAGFRVDVIEQSGTLTGTLLPVDHKKERTSDLALEAQWPSWRGPHGNGAAALEGKPAYLRRAPLVWVSHAAIPASAAKDSRAPFSRGETGLSGGYGGPIVYSGLVYTAYYRPTRGAVFDRKLVERHITRHGYGRDKWHIEADDVIVAMDATDGTVRWKRVFPRRGMNFNGFNEDRSQPLMTPCADDGRVFFTGSGGWVYGLDAHSGRTLWISALGERTRMIDAVREKAVREAKLPRFRADFGSAPVVAGGTLVLNDHVEYMGGQRKRLSGLTGLDPETGRVRWHLPEVCGLTVSPVTWRFEDKEYVLVSGEDKITCADPENGRIIWTLPGFMYYFTPGLHGDILVAQKKNGGRLHGFRMNTTGAHKLWRSRDAELHMTTAVPATVDGNIWFQMQHTARLEQRMVCVDAETGLLRSGMVSTDPAPAAMTGIGSVILGEGFYSATYERYVMPDTVAPNEGSKAATEDVTKTVMSWMPSHAVGTAPAFVDGRLFVRGLNRIYCYDVRDTSPGDE